MSAPVVLAGHDLVERALLAATVSDTVVLVADVSESSLRWAGNSMTTNGIADSRAWTVVSIVRDGETTRVGTVSSTSADPDDVVAVVRAAEDAARTAPPAADAMPLIAGEQPDAGWGDVAARSSIEVFESIVPGLARGFDGADALFGFARHTVRTLWLGTSTGVRRRTVEPTGSFEINGKRGGLLDGASAWVGTHTRDFVGLDVDGMLAELSRRLDWSARRVELSAGRYETILPPSAVADLMIDLMWSMDGRGAQEGRTALSAPGGGTRVGERLGTLGLTLYSDPAEPGLEYAPFVVAESSSDSVSVFDNGVDAERVEWIDDGVISALAYPRSAAAEFGTRPTALGDNLVMTGGAGGTTDDLVARTERGLLLTTLWYIREVDPTTLLLTGLTRDGVYLVEDGRITAEVNNFRFNESPLDLLRRATEAGGTVPTLPREWSDWFTRAAMPPLRVPDFHMSSVSAAR
ncbi:Predicted Zn-dependent protease or its inactivated homolog [Rhodococcoides kroppenstedtii]|uniref:Predicted Zn-dependent protease or its inactivated homolog n=1 Tax=Rhodococcoides kroppenstedtii TaxID=293050 RepID=A0A1I0UEE6_9NOCA|nr:metallopeptidase TldD-related protein [Rhodococcus kroppenstedtii]SFA62157.1 Predicted Zn-dependent protease or its inactivated homolog [Rhodococcus kroppenstedtii]